MVDVAEQARSQELRFTVIHRTFNSRYLTGHAQLDPLWPAPDAYTPIVVI